MTIGFDLTYGLLQRGRDHSPLKACFEESSSWLAFKVYEYTSKYGVGLNGWDRTILTKGMGKPMYGLLLSSRYGGRLVWLYSHRYTCSKDSFTGYSNLYWRLSRGEYNYLVRLWYRSVYVNSDATAELIHFCKLIRIIYKRQRNCLMSEYFWLCSLCVRCGRQALIGICFS